MKIAWVLKMLRLIWHVNVIKKSKEKNQTNMSSVLFLRTKFLSLGCPSKQLHIINMKKKIKIYIYMSVVVLELGLKLFVK